MVTCELSRVSCWLRRSQHTTQHMQPPPPHLCDMTPWVCFGLQLAAPIGRLPLTALLPSDPPPPQAVVPIGLSPPSDLPLPPWPILPSLLPLPFPREVVPTEPPDFPCFTAPCRVHTTVCAAGARHEAMVLVCLPLAAPIGLSPLHIPTLCGPERVLVVSTEPPDDLSCLTTPGVGRPRDGAVARADDRVHPHVHPESSVRGGGPGGRGAPPPMVISRSNTSLPQGLSFRAVPNKTKTKTC